MTITVSDNGNDITSIYDSATFGNALSLRVDEGVGAMTISPSGRDVALASRSGLFIVDLDDPFSPPRFLHHLTAWEVADVQWSPHASKPSWVISTSNQKALIWNLALSSDNAVEHILHGHQRAITDINFHALNPEIIATCSVDSFIHVWDLRNPRKPSQSFADWRAGATQVKWNRRNPHVLASSHDNKVYIWDERKGSIPLRKIEAHDSKVNGLDFSRTEEFKVLTCSNDRTVKLWDYSSDEALQCTFVTNFPVWRARHTPFGKGFAVMPLRGGNNDVFINKISTDKNVVEMNPIYEFHGHSEPIKEFVWRTLGGNTEYEDRAFQLVTWSKDHDLRLWPVSDSVLDSVNYERGSLLTQNITRRGAVYRSYRAEPSVGGKVTRRLSPDKSPDKISYSASPEHRVFGRSRKAGFMTGSTVLRDRRQNDAHLYWISGVRIGRSAFSTSAENGMSPEVDKWSNAPGNLGEEISIVGHKFPKVKFEKISVFTGECVVGLSGPWGENENDLVFIRVEILFPEKYPKEIPKFKIEENHKLSEQVRARVSEELDGIASKLASRGKYCLEPCLRYLLGEEVVLEETEPDSEMEKVESLVSLENFIELSQGFDYSSSSSDDEIIQNVATANKAAVFSKPAFDSTPIPKGCGAVWSKSGTLVCFFTHKNEKTVSLLPSHGDKRVNQLTDISKGLETEEDDSSDSFDSDGDEFLDMRGTTIDNYWLLSSSRFRTNLNSRQLSGKGNSHGPASNTDRSQGTYKVDYKDTNLVKLHDFKYLIPSSFELAKEYQVLGASPQDLARHNASVASKHGYHLAADCWRFIEMLLTVDLPLESYFPKVFPHGVFLNIQDFDGPMFGRFWWGHHPFSRTWMIDQLFEYFEKQQNVQMLANMSCILSGSTMQSSVNNRFQTQNAAKWDNPPLPSPFHHDILPKDTNDSRDYFSGIHSNDSSNEDMANISEGNNSNSQSSYFINARFSPFDIPGKKANVPNISESLDSSKDGSSIMSISPEKFMVARKAVAGMFSRPPIQVQQRSRNISSSKLAGSNPQSYKSQKSNSTSVPLDNDTDFLSGFYNGRLTSRDSFYDTMNGHTEHTSNGIAKVNIEIVNDDLLDFFPENRGISKDQAAASYFQPLLNPLNSERYERYRSQYAAILSYWGLNVESLEVLKFNYMMDYKLGAVKPSVFNDSLSVQIQCRRSIKAQAEDPEIISRKSALLDSYSSQTCQYCKLFVKTRFFQCVNCEHITHFECAAEWWNDSDEEKECCSGCSCKCLNYL